MGKTFQVFTLLYYEVKRSSCGCQVTIWHLGCFHVLAIANNVTMDIRVCVSFSIYNFVLIYAQASQVVLVVKNPPANSGDMKGEFNSWEDPLEEELAGYSSVLAWKIPWTEESVGLVCGVTKSRTRLKWLSTDICPGVGLLDQMVVLYLVF